MWAFCLPSGCWAVRHILPMQILWLVFHVDSWPDAFHSHTKKQLKYAPLLKKWKKTRMEENQRCGKETQKGEHLFQWHSAICPQCCMTNRSKSGGQCFGALSCHSEVSNLLCERCNVFYDPWRKNPIKFSHGEEFWRMPEHDLKSQKGLPLPHFQPDWACLHSLSPVIMSLMWETWYTVLPGYRRRGGKMWIFQFPGLREHTPAHCLRTQNENISFYGPVRDLGYQHRQISIQICLETRHPKRYSGPTYNMGPHC